MKYAGSCESWKIARPGFFGIEQGIAQGDIDDTEINMHPAILSTNRLIYLEAAPMLYSDLTIILRPDDIPCFSRRVIPNDPANLSYDVWRHDPRTSYLAANSLQVYSSPDQGGNMEPHTFAKFQNVELLFTNFCGTEVSLEMDRNLQALPNGVATLSAYYLKLRYFKDFFELLSRSPFIKRLNINLNQTIVESNYREFNMEWEFGEFPLAEGETDGDCEMRLFKGVKAADQRAVEVLFECGALEPLKAFQNVKSFTIDFDDRLLPDILSGDEYEPPPATAAIIQKLKNTIEGNWQNHYPITQTTYSSQPVTDLTTRSATSKMSNAKLAHFNLLASLIRKMRELKEG